MGDSQNKRASWLQTFSGIKAQILDPKPEQILIPDIAHALSNIGRFGGHTRKFSSVAQHCVLTARLSPAGSLKLASILHDSSEAFLIDLPSPIKNAIPQYKEIEERLQKVIATRFGIDFELFDMIKIYDQQALFIEAKALLAPFHPDWDMHDCSKEVDPKLLDFYQDPWIPERAEKEYLEEFHRIWTQTKV